MIFDHAFVLPCGLDPAVELRKSTLKAADAFSARLAEAGFAEGSSRSHLGQGTANRRLFLADMMIECLLVDDEAALDDSRGSALALGPRFRSPQASGVGIAFRPNPGAFEEFPVPDFASSDYRPAYLPGSLHIDVASQFGTDVPLLFHLPFAGRNVAAVDDGEPHSHPNGACGIVNVVFERAVPLPSSAEAVLKSTGIRCKAGASEECLHVQLLGLDDGVELDLRPLYPLRLHS